MTSTQTRAVSMTDKIALIDKWCSAARILPVITIEREADILPLADALAAGGLRVLEITLRSALGLGAIRLLREQRPELIVGAGTVLDANMLEQAEAAGAQFIVSPGSTPALLEAAAARRGQRFGNHARLRPGLSPLQAVPRRDLWRRGSAEGAGRAVRR